MTESDSSGRVKVTDEEHSVVQQLKSSVLKLRQTVDDDERRIYTEKLRDPELRNYSRADANQDWALSVRQYLRAVKRLWDDGKPVSGVSEYWREKNLGSVELAPPDKGGYKFSAVVQDAPPSQLRRFIGLPRGVDLPEPYEYTFRGLKDILNTRIVQQSWTVTVDNSGPPPLHERVTLQSANVIPKPVLENAVEATDAFLQQAGLGFETSLPDYYGGEEPGI